MIAVQPDGKVVIGGGAQPGFGMLARLYPDGGLDRSFGKEGIAVDRRSPPLSEIALLPDGKIVALDAWNRVRRYEPDGHPDPSFGRNGEAHPSLLGDAAFMTLFPDGRIGVAGYYLSKSGYISMSAYVYAADGRSAAQAKELSTAVSALAVDGDGSLLMAGATLRDPFTGEEGRSVLGRLLPGADPPFDPAFGGGSGFVTIPYPGSSPRLTDLVPVSGGWLATGTAAGRLVTARFSDQGQLDSGFGSGGFADAALQPGFSQGNDLTVQPDGKLVVAGEVSNKGWTGYSCSKCHPLAVRFLSGGDLDPSFGSGGIVRLAQAGRPALRARAESVVALPAGRILVAGRSTARRPRSVVSGLMPNGAIDRGFGEGGVVTVDACPGSPAAQRHRGCMPSVLARLRIPHGSGWQGAIRLSVRPNVDWASVTEISLTLPDRLRVVEERRRSIRATLLEVDGRRRSTRVAVEGRELRGHWTVGPKSISLRVPATALQRIGEVATGRRLPFRIRVAFGTDFFEYPDAGTHEIVLRRAIG